MLQGQALIQAMTQRAGALAEGWTPAAGPFTSYLAFSLCHAYLEGATDALKDEIARHKDEIDRKAAGAAPLAARTRRTGKTP